MKPEVGHGATQVYARVQGGGSKLIQERVASVTQAARDFGMHGIVLRSPVEPTALDEGILIGFPRLNMVQISGPFGIPGHETLAMNSGPLSRRIACGAAQESLTDLLTTTKSAFAQC